MGLLKSLGLNKYFGQIFRRCKGSLLHTVFLLLLVVGAGMVAMHLAKRVGLVKEGYKGRKELLLLHMEGCPHCETLLPKWDVASASNKSGVKMTKVERKDDPALVDKHGVSGFPAILLLDSKGNKLEQYKGPRSTQGITDYCNKHGQA